MDDIAWSTADGHRWHAIGWHLRAFPLASGDWALRYLDRVRGPQYVTGFACLEEARNGAAWRIAENIVKARTP